MLGMNRGHTSRRNKKITITTSPIDKARVNSTSFTDARITCVRIDDRADMHDGGIDASSAGNAALMRSTVSITLAPGCLNASSSTPRLPFCQAVSSRFWRASHGLSDIADMHRRAVLPATTDIVCKAPDPSTDHRQSPHTTIRTVDAPLGLFTVAVVMTLRTSSNVRPILASFAGSICTRIAGFCWPTDQHLRHAGNLRNC